ECEEWHLGVFGERLCCALRDRALHDPLFPVATAYHMVPGRWFHVAAACLEGAAFEVGFAGRVDFLHRAAKFKAAQGLEGLLVPVPETDVRGMGRRRTDARILSQHKR